jgi:hypothetical protein
MTDYESFEADQQALLKASLEALRASQTRPLTEEEAMTLAWSAGLANTFYKEFRK